MKKECNRSFVIKLSDALGFFCWVIQLPSILYAFGQTKEDRTHTTSLVPHFMILYFFVTRHIIFINCNNNNNNKSLASDLQRVVGHCLVMETPDIKYVHDVLKDDPVLRSLTDDGERLRDVPIYRWRHIRDHTLRIDDGRLGFPCMMVGLDDEPEIVGNTRIETRNATLEHMIRSEKVIAAGPLHLPTSLKDDPSSIAVGDLVMFNAKDREDAISFVETMPSAMAGLYKDLRVHFYNDLDVTGKFVSEDPMRDAPGYQMKEAMEYWGYPVDDDQTPWLNW